MVESLDNCPYLRIVQERWCCCFVSFYVVSHDCTIHRRASRPPLRDIVVFPHMIVPLFVGREKSIKALEAVMVEGKQIILATQTEASIEDPDAEGLYTTGTVGSILQLLKNCRMGQSRC